MWCVPSHASVCLQVCSRYWDCYKGRVREIMQQKLGIMSCEGDADDNLIAGLLRCMQKSSVDMHVTFRNLALIPMLASAETVEGQSAKDFLDAVLATAPSPQARAAKLRSRMDPRELQLLQQLASTSPMAVMSLGISTQVCPCFAWGSCSWDHCWARDSVCLPTPLGVQISHVLCGPTRSSRSIISWILQAIQQEVAKNSQADELAKVDEAEKRQEDEHVWQEWLTMYRDRLIREHSHGTSPEQRINAMNSKNPTVVLRNWVAQVAVDEASRGNYSIVCAQAYVHVHNHPLRCTVSHLICPCVFPYTALTG